ncbi:uncharacterized protein V1513DRAFT_443509 [Lipomyces chichibuensis]|uniref:uncharacterized protein n=1 Tax=Lipomyces chichibuensis TaxID=1546026 RepID=UPI00334358BE
MKNLLRRGKSPSLSGEPGKIGDASQNYPQPTLSVPPSYKSSYDNPPFDNSYASYTNRRGRRTPSASYNTNPHLVRHSYSVNNQQNGVSLDSSDDQRSTCFVTTADRNRDELFEGYQLSRSPSRVVANRYIPAPSYHEYDENYDPSIMETEAERRARNGDYDDRSAYNSGTLYQAQQFEDEDQELLAIKGHIKHISEETDRIALNATVLANQAYESGTRTLRMLGEQDDMLTSAGIALTQTERHNIAADDNLMEIRTSNRPLLAPNVRNPFSRAPKRRERALKTLANNDRVTLETNYYAKNYINNALGEQFSSQGRAGVGLSIGSLYVEEEREKEKKQMIEQSPYMFEADEEDLNTERSIRSRLDELSIASKKLNLVAKTINMTLEQQNQRLEGMSSQSDRVNSTLYLQSLHMRYMRNDKCVG